MIGTGEYLFGQEAHLVANPNEGYCLLNWTEDGKILSTEQSYNFKVYKDKTLNANFELQLQIDEFNSDIHYKLYPNPANNILFLKGFENELLNISILSIDGRLIKQLQAKGINQIDIGELQNSIYLVRIMNSKIMVIKKIVKQ